MTNIHEWLEGKAEFPRFQQDFSASMEQPLSNGIRMKPAPCNKASWGCLSMQFCDKDTISPEAEDVSTMPF